VKIWSLMHGDIRFQYKYGFYFLYVFLTVLYIGLIFVLPEGWREKAVIIMIFSDPAAVGLYFMGAIILFEKSERVLDSIAVSPVRPYEYMLSKLFSISLISVAVGLTIGFFSNVVNITVNFIFGIFLCSCLFSAVGLVIATKSTSLNGFVIATVPVQIIINIPAVAWLFGWKPGWLLLHPGVSVMEIFESKNLVSASFVILAFWTVLAAVIANQAVKNMFEETGGIKL